MDKVKQAIKKLKCGNVSGEDDVCAEMLKAGGEETARRLCQILQNIWETEQIPEDRKTGLIITLPKKGDLSDCRNWRGITLLSLTSKVFCCILLNRISETLYKYCITYLYTDTLFTRHWEKSHFQCNSNYSNSNSNSNIVIILLNS